MKIQVKCEDTGKVFDNDMSKNDSIIEIHFCTSYTLVVVQEKKENEAGKTIWPTRDIILPPIGTKSNWVDMIAVQEDSIGEWVLEATETT